MFLSALDFLDSHLSLSSLVLLVLVVAQGLHFLEVVDVLYESVSQLSIQVLSSAEQLSLVIFGINTNKDGEVFPQGQVLYFTVHLPKYVLEGNGLEEAQFRVRGSRMLVFVGELEEFVGPPSIHFILLSYGIAEVSRCEYSLHWIGVEFLNLLGIGNLSGYEGTSLRPIQLAYSALTIGVISHGKQLSVILQHENMVGSSLDLLQIFNGRNFSPDLFVISDEFLEIEGMEGSRAIGHPQVVFGERHLLAVFEVEFEGVVEQVVPTDLLEGVFWSFFFERRNPPIVEEPETPLGVNAETELLVEFHLLEVGQLGYFGPSLDSLHSVWVEVFELLELFGPGLIAAVSPLIKVEFFLRVFSKDKAKKGVCLVG